MKLHTTEHARKQYTCAKCFKPIEIGASFYWWEPLRSRPVRWHIEHGNPYRSLLVSSPYIKKVYEQQERLQNFIEKTKTKTNMPDFNGEKIALWLLDFNELVVDVLTECDDVANEYYASADKIERRFGATPQVHDCRDKGKLINHWMGKMDALAAEFYDVSGDLLAIFDKVKYMQKLNKFLDYADTLIRSLTL